MIKNIIKNIIKRTSLYKPLVIFKESIKYIPLIVFYYLCRMLPIENKVVFSSFAGEYFNAQPKMIFDALNVLNNKVKVIWILKSDIKPEGVYKVVPPYSFKEMYELATSRVWIDNRRKDYWIKKRKKQYYIQTWHGPVCIKAVEKDTEDTLPFYYVKSAIQDSKNADCIVAETKWRYKNICEAFWYSGEILKGQFIDYTHNEECLIKRKVAKYYNIKQSIGIILYAPTFRKNGNITCYNINIPKTKKIAEERYKKEFVFIYRLHPNIIDKQESIEYSDDVLNGSEYESIDELVIASDIIITDYSGIMFDGFRYKKNVLIYAEDIDNYIREDRKMYFDLYDLPSPISSNNQELITNIKNFNEIEYHEKRKSFVEQLGYYDVDASKKCAQIINRVLRSKT